MNIRLTNTEKEEIENLYKNENYNFIDIGRKLNRYESTIRRYLNSLGYIAKSQSELQRKYTIVEDFFDKIDTEEKAYILGLLYADGYNNTDKNDVCISLKEDDVEILNKITNIIQPTKPLFYLDMSPENRGMKNSKNQYRLTINNKHISKRLVELGCGKAKTHNLVFPTGTQVPKYLQRHFIRGYFDGDGSVSGDKQKQLSFVGTIDFLLPLQQILIEELGFSKTKLDQRHKEREDEIRSLRYCGINQCITFRDWLYKDATICMERKKNIFDTY